MVSRCGAPPGLQLGACALGLPPDSFRPTWIGAEGGTERKKWVAALTSHPPPMGAPLAHFGEQGIHIPMSSHTVGGGHITRSSSPPYQPRPSSLPTPPTQGFLSWALIGFRSRKPIRGGRSKKYLGPQGLWPGAFPLAVPLPPVGPTPLTGSLDWGGLAEKKA